MQGAKSFLYNTLYIIINNWLMMMIKTGKEKEIEETAEKAKYE
jgi:hypothetical protein